MSENAFRPKPSSAREKRNWYIGLLYVRQEYSECLVVIEDQLRECGGLCEYPLYVKALILRQRGKIQESLTLFQSATCLNPGNIANLKQVRHVRARATRVRGSASGVGQCPTRTCLSLREERGARRVARGFVRARFALAANASITRT